MRPWPCCPGDLPVCNIPTKPAWRPVPHSQLNCISSFTPPNRSDEAYGVKVTEAPSLVLLTHNAVSCSSRAKTTAVSVWAEDITLQGQEIGHQGRLLISVARSGGRAKLVHGRAQLVHLERLGQT